MKKLNKFMCVFLSAAMLVSAGTTSLADRSAEPQIGYYRAAASEQGVEGFISRLYKLAMGRDADGDGLKYWCDQLDNGTITASNIARFFFSCDEFYSLNYNVDNYVKVLYRVFFNREPDASGYTYWNDQIFYYGATRREVLEGFIASQEWADICASYGVVCGTGVVSNVSVGVSDGTKTFVKSLYNDVLGRKEDKDGFNYWCNELVAKRASAKSCAFGFTDSSEFKNKCASMSGEDMVKVFYKVFLDREPDKDGLKYWSSKAKGKNGINDLFEGFCNSEEFVNKCKELGIMVNFPAFDAAYSTPENPNETFTYTNAAGETIVVRGHYDRALAQQVFDKTNAVRTSRGIPALQYNQDLQRSANVRSRELVYNTTHTRPDGSKCTTAFPESGRVKGENLLSATAGDAEWYMSAWINSTYHMGNMLDTDYNYLAVSVFVTETTYSFPNGSGYTYFVIQDFMS